MWLHVESIIQWDFKVSGLTSRIIMFFPEKIKKKKTFPHLCTQTSSRLNTVFMSTIKINEFP